MRVIVTGNRDWTDDGTIVAALADLPLNSDHGKAAGPIRNAHVVSLGADACYAFGALERNGKRTGTGDCVAKAKRAGIPVTHWEAK